VIVSQGFNKPTCDRRVPKSSNFQIPKFTNSEIRISRFLSLFCPLVNPDLFDDGTIDISDGFRVVAQLLRAGAANYA
jgi:hypothetical protein